MRQLDSSSDRRQNVWSVCSTSSSLVLMLLYPPGADLISVFFQLFPMKSERLRSTHRPASSWQSLFIKVADGVTVACFLSLGLGDNIHHTFVSYRSCLAPTSSLLWCPDVKLNKQAKGHCWSNKAQQAPEIWTLQGHISIASGSVNYVPDSGHLLR